MGNKKHFGEEDRVLRFAVIAVAVLLLIAAIVVAGRMGNLREDSAAGEEKLEQMAKMNVQMRSGFRSLRMPGTARMIRTQRTRTRGARDQKTRIQETRVQRIRTRRVRMQRIRMR